MVSQLLNRLVTAFLRAILFSYRYFLSPLLHLIAGSGFGCRFEPTCGQFAKEALEDHGPARGSFLAIHRVCRCHPFTRGGYDPVPPGASKRR